ncbi:hypothetical protein DMN91_012821 [Ooceraea biroi]|uniref:Uncharacterized protein n=1 Tax=Ooceraea biroi TaxID=2015173 RepID=A0A3L8D3Y7_OOCBI|nr:hypothetical protein DMN91_012821 [Ooceraea biroi]
MASDDIILEERLHNYLTRYIKKSKLVAPKFYITNGAKKGDNYVGLIYRVTIESNENGEIEKRRLIVKTARAILIPGAPDFTNMFQREMFFYQEAVPTFRETLKEHGIIERFPTFYDAEGEMGKEVITRAIVK